MIATPFDYHRPKSVEDAASLLAQLGDDAKILAGGHSLIPALKLRLARPAALVDVARIEGLKDIREVDNRIHVGALCTHSQIAASELLREKCPLLTKVAPQIGDVQVRNRGSIGGSAVHNDPAGDWPAAILALDAEVEITGAQGSRVVKAKDFFMDLFQTALRPNEILREIRFPVTGRKVAYVKTPQKASGFATAGVAVVIHEAIGKVAIGITGVAARAFRSKASEVYLKGKPLDAARIAKAAERSTRDVQALSDIHASAEFRLHLARLNTRKALEQAAAQ